MKKLFLFIIFYFTLCGVTFADVGANIIVPISSNGDIPPVTIECLTAHNYTLSLVHQSNDNVSNNLGVIERLFCKDNQITFSGLNINLKLFSVDQAWWNWVGTPLEYIIKDTTGPYILNCDESYCPLVNLSGDFNFYNNSVYLASSTYWTTVASGPIFNTSDHTTWFNVDHQELPKPVDEYSNVLFLPGLEASRLYKPDYNGGVDKIWEPNNDYDTTKLLLDNEGSSLRDDIYTKDVIDNAYVPIKGNIYKSFLEDLDKWKNIDHIINDYEVVPYDWRLSLDDILSTGNRTSDGKIYYSGPNGATSTPYIIQELRRLSKNSKTGKVTIIAHSNGGLVAKALTDKLGTEASELIDKIIFVAVPQIGTPKAIGAMLHGYDQGLPFDSMSLFITPKAARTLSQNMPSAYNLLPSAQYFIYIDDPVIKFDPTLTDWVNRYGSIIHSQESLHNFLVDTNGRVSSTSADISTPVSLNSTLLVKAENQHLSLDKWVPPAGVELIEIAGWGEDTLATIEYYKGEQKICTNFSSATTCSHFITVPTVLYNPKEIIDGDGTVVVPSALWSATSTGVMKYWVNLKKYNDPFFSISRKHADILEIPELRILINNILKNSTSTLPELISTSTPQDTENKLRLRFLLHSPLDISATDNLGNSISSTTSTIPGSRFTRYGEVQVLTVPKNIPLTLNLDGYATGSFTLDMEEIDGNNIVIASSTFSAIPSATSTKAVMEFADGTLQNASPLSVDYNGDNKTDFTIVPKIGEIVSLDTTPPEAVISFSTTTQNIIVSGIDETSGTTVVNTATSSIISDDTHNTLKVFFLKFKEEMKEVKLQISGLEYNDILASSTPKTILKYEWSNDKAGKIKEFEEKVATGKFIIEGHYDIKKNVTIIEKSIIKIRKGNSDNDRKDNEDMLNKSEKKTKEIRSGLVIIGVKTSNGIINLNY